MGGVANAFQAMLTACENGHSHIVEYIGQPYRDFCRCHKKSATTYLTILRYACKSGCLDTVKRVWNLFEDGITEAFIIPKEYDAILDSLQGLFWEGDAHLHIITRLHNVMFSKTIFSYRAPYEIKHRVKHLYYNILYHNNNNGQDQIGVLLPVAQWIFYVVLAQDNDYLPDGRAEFSWIAQDKRTWKWLLQTNQQYDVANGSRSLADSKFFAVFSFLNDDFNGFQKYISSAVAYTCKVGTYEIARWVCDTYLPLLNEDVRHSLANGVLSHACYTGNLGIITLFKDDVRPDTNIAYLLEVAASSSHLHVLRWFHVHFKETVHAVIRDGTNTVFRQAVISGHMPTIHWLDRTFGIRKMSTHPMDVLALQMLKKISIDHVAAWLSMN